MNDLQQKLKLLPKTSGIYKFKDQEKRILYIGKAINLFSRVNSYFSDQLFDRPRIVLMIPLISDVEVIETSNEIEALVLESALIKKYQPEYNMEHKDDKSYAYLYIDTQNEYPTVRITREVTKKMRRGKIFGPYPSGKSIKQVFNYLRRLYPFCTDDPKKPCFYSHIGLCPGPSATKEEYRVNINNIVKFLQGRKRTHIKDLEREMNRLSKEKEYEKAAMLRDRINDLKYLGSKINFTYDRSEEEYIKSKKEINIQSMEELSNELGIKNLSRIECYDISNISGMYSYGSMTVAINGELKQSMYRIFKIKEEGEPNDPAMLLEVLNRRLKHINSDTDESLGTKPDLILIDGGVSQLSFLLKTLSTDIPLMGISKGKRIKRRGAKRIDEFWITRKQLVFPIKLQTSSILIKLRDEAHRFAIIHHRNLRKKKQTKSFLDDVKGVGDKTRRKLLKEFKDKNGIKNAGFEKLNFVIKNKNTTQRIIDLVSEQKA